jgi:hypothetical protein
MSATREPRRNAADEILVSYGYSSALQRVGCRLEYVRKGIRRDPRKVIPVAALARTFDISPRLLWKWIADGWIGRVRGEEKPGEMKRRRGVPKRAALQFLTHLERPASLYDDSNSHFGGHGDDDDWSPRSRVDSRAGRPDTAQQKIREARRMGIDGQGMNPRQFAEAVGVSRSAVWRAIHARTVDWWNPTPHRTLIGKRPRTPKKVGKRQKKSLTRKNR